jgi:hypothetical protein
MKTDPGAPAFPRKGDDPNSLGLTKREYFVAGRAVRYADELIEVLQQRQQPATAGDQP